MQPCPTCGQQTPPGNFCVRCGSPLDQQLTRARERGQFAAAPNERRWAPWLISTLFPHLPRHSDRHFHVALAIGGTVVVVLGALRLFPVALITAAALMPLLATLYFYDVDLYEGEPAWTAVLTLLYGAVAGVAVGVLAKAVAPTGPSLIDRGSTAHVVTGGILLPALGVVLMVGGPLMLLRYRGFNEVLDGATFGAVTAATFAAAEAIVVGIGVLNGGLRPSGAALPWVERLIALAIATPVLAMSAVGAACAAIWLRYRAPVGDRNALGILGRPPVAVAIAAALVIAGAVGETFMPSGLWLAWLIVLDVIGLELLRRSLHLGLLEEAAEVEIGPEIRCVNCGQVTATHTFCSNCGIALKALPKVSAPQAGEAATRRGASAGRLAAGGPGEQQRPRRLLAYGAGLLVVVGVAFAIGALAATPPPKSRCKRGVPCGKPPIFGHVLYAFPGYTAWQSTGLGYTLRYDDNDWSIASQSADDLVLQGPGGGSLLAVSAVPSNQATALALLRRQVSALQGQLLGMAPDTSPPDQVLGTNVGLTPGPGGVYTATISTPQGPQAPVAVAVVASSNGSVTIAVTVIAPGDDADAKQAAYEHADDVLNSIVF